MPLLVFRHREDPDPPDEHTGEQNAPSSSESPQPDLAMHIVASRPWHRFWARQFDYLAFAFAVGLFGPILLPGTSGIQQAFFNLHDALLGVILSALWIFPEAVLLSTFGTTPGKWLFYIRIHTEDGHRPSFAAAIKRSFQVWFLGMGLGIPIVSLFTMVAAHRRLVAEGASSWDRRNGLLPEHKTPSVKRLLIAGLPLIGAIAALAWFGAHVEDVAQDDARRSLDISRAALAASLHDEGIRLSQVSPLYRGSLSSGEQIRFDLDLPEGSNYVALGACDEECPDIDLMLISASGDVLAVDDDPDAEPIVFLDSGQERAASLLIDMVSCDMEPCWVAARIYWLDGKVDRASSGTCFAVSNDGLVVTSRHVVEGVTGIQVTFDGVNYLPATTVSVAEDADVAVLDLATPLAHYLPLAPAGGPALGEDVFTVGFPMPAVLGLAARHASGTALVLEGPEGDPSRFQMSMPVQPGNSGGAVVNDKGLVVGVVSSGSRSKGLQNETGGLPRHANIAVKAGSLGDLVPRAGTFPPARNLMDAIDRVRRATCYLEATSE